MSPQVLRSVLAALLVSAVFAQEMRQAVIIDESDPSHSAKTVYFGLLEEKTNASRIDLYRRLHHLEHLIAQLEHRIRHLAMERMLEGDTEEERRLNAYKRIARMQPVFWLSAHYFDGLKLVNGSRAANGVTIKTDLLGNAVTQSGVLNVVNDQGNSAFAFTTLNQVLSPSAVSATWTFVAAFRWPSVTAGGRFFTSTVGNRLFAGHGGIPCVMRFYVEGWIDADCVRSTQVEIDVGMNNNGAKSLWREHMNVVSNANIGANDWGQTVLGRPAIYPNEATDVFVYEAMVFPYALGAGEREYVTSVLSKYLKH